MGVVEHLVGSHSSTLVSRAYGGGTRGPLVLLEWHANHLSVFCAERWCHCTNRCH